MSTGMYYSIMRNIELEDEIPKWVSVISGAARVCSSDARNIRDIFIENAALLDKVNTICTHSEEDGYVIDGNYLGEYGLMAINLENFLRIDLEEEPARLIYEPGRIIVELSDVEDYYSTGVKVIKSLKETFNFLFGYELDEYMLVIGFD